MRIDRPPGPGWLALLGGGEFSFGETEDADAAWLERTPAGAIGFVPAASGSSDYGDHIAIYFDEVYQRPCETIPIYRGRDARRGRNLDRIGSSAAVYLGGGVVERLVEALHEQPAEAALRARLETGGTVVAIAAAAQALGVTFRRLQGAAASGLGWLPGGVVETNFTPAHDRRLRKLMARAEVRWGVGIPAGGALLLGPDGTVETVGQCFGLDDPDSDLKLLS